jgi:hypothetical protein
MLVEAGSVHIPEGGLDMAPGLGGTIGTIFHANALVELCFFTRLPAMNDEKLASEFDDGCVLLHADLPVLRLMERLMPGE